MSPITIKLTSSESAKQNNLFQEVDFKGKCGDYFYDFHNKILYVGTTYEMNTIYINDFEKVNFYELGQEVSKKLPKSIEEIIIDNNGLDIEDLGKFVIGIRQGEYKYTEIIKPDFKLLNINYTNPISQDSIDYIQAVCDGVFFTRQITDMRASELTPKTYPEILQKKFSKFDSTRVKLTIVDKSAIDELGMGMLGAVGLASEHGYNIVAIEVLPKKEVTKTIAFVGKGLTFDNGGVNIKERGFSFGMHGDMGGSAIVFGTALTMSQTKQLESTRLVFVSGIVENGINEMAMHPGDIVTNLVGQTALVKNTDAEGRLTLADVAPWTVINYNPSEIVTVATLTGHAIMAFTDKRAPIFSNDLDLHTRVYQAFLNQKEEAVKAALPRKVWEAIKDESGISDMINTNNYKGPQGDSYAAAAFVMSSSQPGLWKKHNQQLPTTIKTAHIDVAGPTVDSKEMCTGYGVRSLVDYCLNIQE